MAGGHSLRRRRTLRRRVPAGAAAVVTIAGLVLLGGVMRSRDHPSHTVGHPAAPTLAAQNAAVPHDTPAPSMATAPPATPHPGPASLPVTRVHRPPPPDAAGPRSPHPRSAIEAAHPGPVTHTTRPPRTVTRRAGAAAHRTPTATSDFRQPREYPSARPGRAPTTQPPSRIDLRRHYHTDHTDHTDHIDHIDHEGFNELVPGL